MGGRRISVIVPAYNIAPYLGRCLDSLLAQTHVDLEIIVVDDGSKDGTGAILEAYAEREGRIIPVHQKNGGVTSARFAGLKLATGEYIGFADGDDYVEPDMFELLFRQAETHRADISHCGYQMVFPNGRVDWYYNTGRTVEQDRETGLYDLICGRFVEPGLWNKLYRAELLQSLLTRPALDRDIRINEDLLMNFILFSDADRSIYTDQCKYHYMIRRGSAATSRPQGYKFSDPQRVMERLYQDTMGNDRLHGAALERYVRVLTGNCTQDQFPEIASSARKKLYAVRRELDKLPAKLRCMALGALYARPLYRMVRKAYDTATGAAHKYDVE